MRTCTLPPWLTPRILLALVLLLGLLGCDALDNAACDTSAAAGLMITVTAGDGGQPLCAASVAVTDGSYTEYPQAVGNPCQYNAAYERPGKYTVTVKQNGYQAATKTGIVVTEGECHVSGVSVPIALLQ